MIGSAAAAMARTAAATAPVACLRTATALLRRGAALAPLGAVLAAACTTTTPASSDVLRNPRSIALLCQTSAGPKPIADCATGAEVRAYISGGSLGSIAIANPAASTFVDTDPTTPGFSPKMIGDLPQALVADPRDGSRMVFALGLQPRLGRLRLPELAVDWADIPFVPAALVGADAGGATIYWAADPAGGAVWRIGADAFDGGPAPQRFEIGGSPWSLAVHADGRVFIGHLRDDHITVLAPSGALLARIGLVAACGDDVDDDGDGLTDAADPGCDDERDDDERDPELPGACTNGVDDDGDGLTDAADAGCDAAQGAAPRADACRNGVDDDGDGATDYPSDLGCISRAAPTEAHDAPACSDGVDNDGDGLSDFPADKDCTDAQGGAELSAVDASAVGPCNDGVDEDGDGLTDLADSDCVGPFAAGERRMPCADGVDNDGDGATDLADSACPHRGAPAEVAAEDAAGASLALTTAGDLLVVGHRGRAAIYVVDTATLVLVEPQPGGVEPYLRPSRLDAREGLRGLSLPGAPLSLAPIRLDERGAIALTVSLAGLAYLQLEAAPDLQTGVAKRQIALREASETPKTTATKPTLQVGGVTIDLGSVAPSRYANPGTLDTDNDQRYYGLLPTTAVADHRSELWRLIFQGRIPGSARQSGRLRAPTLLVDPGADFCRMGVVTGDLVLVHRAHDAAPCQGLPAGTTRWRVAAVQPDRLVLDGTSGRRDVAVTAVNQVEAPVGDPVAALPTGCFVDGGVRYEVRADGWLVEGSRSGLLSSRAAQGATCAPYDELDPLQAARIVEPSLIAGKSVATCPLSTEDLATATAQRPYAGGAATAPKPFANAVFSLQMQPGCSASDVPGVAPTVLPSIRDATWRYVVASGVQPRLVNVGAAAVAMASAPALGLLYVVDQGSGVLAVVDVARAAVAAVLD